MTAGDQARILAAMMACGACMGMTHDLLGVMRRGKASAAAADLLLGIAAAALVIAAGLRLGCNPLRMYTFLGAALGWAIYAASLGTIVRALRRRICGIVKKSEKMGKKRQIDAGE